MARVALIGTGFIGEVHAGAYGKIDNAQLVAVVSTTEQKGRAFARKHGARYYPSLPDALQEEEIDCVDICTPTKLHADMTIQAAQAGLNILCEKPLALNLEDADRMIEAVRKAGVKAMAGHTIRFWPEYVAAKQIIDSGQLGAPLHAFCTRLAATPDWHKNGWGMDEKSGGGASLDLHIHDLDYLMWLFGRPKLVNAVGVRIDALGGIAHINTNVSFENGTSAVAEGGWAFGSSFPFTMAFRILCEKGTIEWIFRAGKNIENRSEKSALVVYWNDGRTDTHPVPEEDAYVLECTYFADSVDEGRDITNATFEDARGALELALAATVSAKEDRTVAI